MKQSNSNGFVSLNIEDFISIAKNMQHIGDYSPIAYRFMYDLSTLTGSKIWRDREAANHRIKILKEYYLLDANATIDELENEITTRFNIYKIYNPNWYKQTEYSKAFAKMMSRI